MFTAVQCARIEYDWEISNIQVKMDGKHDRLAVAVNGEIPMPLAKAQLGDTLVLNLRNSLEGEPTGLHSHGILNNGTNYYDGAGMVTECGVAPGSQMAYEIPLNQTGTYWVHGHHNSQYINGLRGPLIVTDPAGEPYDYDDDYVLTLEDWFPHASDVMIDPFSMPQSSASNSTFRKSPEEKYPIGVINGVSGDSAPDLPFAPNATYRVRLLNIGSTSMFRFAIDDHDMHVIEADGVSSEKRKVDHVVLGVAQRISVLVSARPEATRNSRYYFEIFTDVFPESPGYNPRLYSGAVSYTSESDVPAPKRPGSFDELTFDDLDLVPFDRQSILPPPDASHDVIVSASRSATDIMQAYINGVSFALPRVPSIFTALGYQGDGSISDASFGRRCNAKVLQHLDTVELFVANIDTVTHPMHLHGHFFQIIERGILGDPKGVRKSSQYPMRRDTVLVGPNSYVKLRFRADNPGVWLMHCHIERHMELGLSMMFVSAPDVMRQTIQVPEALKDQCRQIGVTI
ncbi:ferroxidase fet3 [Coemansia sp. RSA 1813]|nr:ferroxidase fet3 [Coemansia sp. RSA 1646]KAJ1768551.1 ferroxidase fet3 [Coemansia sp. RSA 1843]KAJ2086156.1 ferroxidase fet3 [Coemansia sp. RSA 986]KAJ2210835.1 ferroxidase fet3 [Coemansia sp. RSA 487]KAJ2566289.1 ferroxidase fet3 [Coemansia sp. RSA 1813]